MDTLDELIAGRAQKQQAQTAQTTSTDGAPATLDELIAGRQKQQQAQQTQTDGSTAPATLDELIAGRIQKQQQNQPPPDDRLLAAEGEITQDDAQHLRDVRAMANQYGNPRAVIDGINNGKITQQYGQEVIQRLQNDFHEASPEDQGLMRKREQDYINQLKQQAQPAEAAQPDADPLHVWWRNVTSTIPGTAQLNLNRLREHEQGLLANNAITPEEYARRDGLINQLVTYNPFHPGAPSPTGGQPSTQNAYQKAYQGLVDRVKAIDPDYLGAVQQAATERAVAGAEVGLQETGHGGSLAAAGRPPAQSLYDQSPEQTNVSVAEAGKNAQIAALRRGQGLSEQATAAIKAETEKAGAVYREPGELAKAGWAPSPAAPGSTEAGLGFLEQQAATAYLAPYLEAGVGLGFGKLAIPFKFGGDQMLSLGQLYERSFLPALARNPMIQEAGRYLRWGGRFDAFRRLQEIATDPAQAARDYSDPWYIAKLVGDIALTHGVPLVARLPGVGLRLGGYTGRGLAMLMRGAAGTADLSMLASVGAPTEEELAARVPFEGMPSQGIPWKAAQMAADERLGTEIPLEKYATPLPETALWAPEGQYARFSDRGIQNLPMNITGTRAVSEAYPAGAGSSLIPQLIRRSVVPYTAGALTAVPFDIGKPIPEIMHDMNQQGIFNLLFSAPHILGGSIRGSQADKGFAYSQSHINDKDLPMPRIEDPNNPGQPHPLQQQVWNALSTLDKPRRNDAIAAIEMAKKEGMDYYPLPDALAQKIMREKYGTTGSVDGLFGKPGDEIDPNWNRSDRPQIYVPISRVDFSSLHEAVGHAAWHLLDPEDQAAIRQHLENDPNFDKDAFVRKYARSYSDGVGRQPTGYDDLPTQAQIDSGDREALAKFKDWGNLTKENAMGEAAVEHFASVYSSDKFENWKKSSPGWTKKWGKMLSDLMQKIGFPGTTADVDGPLSVNKSYVLGAALRPYLRRLASGEFNITNRPPAGTVKIPGVTGRAPEPPPAPVPPTRPEPTFEAIQRRAFEKYQAREAAGIPGDEKADWAAAEEELRGQKFEKVPDAEKVAGLKPGTPPYYHRMLELINEGVDPGTAHEVAVGNMRKATTAPKTAPAFMPATGPRGESGNKEHFADWLRGLAPDEHQAVQHWIGGAHYIGIRNLQKAETFNIPTALRDRDALEAAPVQKAWESAIDKSPVHQGPAYRGLRNLTDEDIARFKDPTNVLRTYADASASTDQSIAANYAGAGPNVRNIEPGKHALILEVHGSHGSINPHGEYPWPIGISNEKEVVLPRRTRYEVKDFRENYWGPNAHHAVLEQLPETATAKPTAHFMPATGKGAVAAQGDLGFKPSVVPPPAPGQQEQKQEDTYGGAILKRLSGELGQESLEPPEAPAPAVKGWSKIPRGANTSLETLQPDFAPKVEAWLKAMREAGFNPQIVQAGRSPEYQAELYARYQHGGPKAAPPESSYHSYGRAVDWVNLDRNGNMEWENHKAYDFGRKLAQQFGLTGISGDEDHLQDAGYATSKELPKEEYGQVHGGGEYVANPEDMDTHLDGVLKGKGNAFIEAGRKYGVDPKLLAAIAMFETGNGSSKAAHAYNNIAGLMDRHSPDQRGFQIFKSVEDSIDSEAALIRDYMDHGLRTIAEIGSRYAPVGQGGKPVANDRNDTNKDWPRFVAAFYEKLGGHAGGEDLGAPEQEWRRYVRGSSGTIDMDNDVMSRRDGAFNTAQIRKELGWGREWTKEKTGGAHSYLEEQEQGGGGNIENAGGMPGETTEAPAAPGGGGGGGGYQQPSAVSPVNARLPAAQVEEAQTEAPAAPSALERAYTPSGYDYEMPVSQEGSEVPSYMMAQEMTGRPFGATQAPGYAAFMPRTTPSYMPGRRKKPGEEEEEPEEEPGDLGSILGRIGSASSQKAQTNLLGQALRAHAASLGEGDKRVQKDPITGLFKGEHFVPGDPMHEYALANTPEEHKQIMRRAETAMRNGQLMYLTHIAAPAQPGVLPTRGSRTAEYTLSPAQQRAIGAERGIVSGHAILPTAEGISFAKKKGEKNVGFVQGISTSVAASNAQHINDQLGDKSPYPDITSKKFLVDLHGYLHNINNGWEGDGSKPVKGTEEIPINPTPGHIPFPMTRREADFMNAIMNNTAAQEKGPNAKKLREFARVGGKLLSTEGEVNPIRAEINAAEAQRRMAALQKAPHDPVLRDIASKLWSQDIMEPTIRHFRGDLIHAVHDRPEEMHEAIRPPEGTAEVQHAMMRQGLPRKEMVAAGYMPMAGKRAKGFAQAEKEGRTFETPLPGGGKRFEIDDRDMEFKPPSKLAATRFKTPPRNALEEKTKTSWGEPMALENVIRHPGLFENYPWLRKLKVAVDPGIRHGGYYQYPFLGDEGGKIVLREPTDKETLAHEIQHAVQYYENFSGKGASSQQILEALRGSPAVKEELGKQYASMHEWGEEEPTPEDKRFREAWEDKRLHDMAKALYRMDPGEVEARVAGQRAMRVRPEEAQGERPGWETAGGPTEAQLRETTPKEDLFYEMAHATSEGRKAGVISPTEAGGFYGSPRSEGPAFMAATRKQKAKKSPEQLAAEKEDLRQAAIDREDITPEQRYELQHVQKLAQQWVKDNPDLPETAAHHYLEGRADFPDWVSTKEHVGKHFGEVNPKLDYSKDEHQEIAAHALVHDIMRALAKKSTAYGWYDRNVDKSLKKISQIAPKILSDPEHAMAFKLATAITSQGQDVFPNFESGYLAYRHWVKTGKLPESADVFGGGTKAKAMIANFKKINDLWSTHGFDAVKDILETKMPLGKLRDDYGIKLGGESPKHEMEGAALLGPKIGSFFNNLNKRFHTITFDLWASRTMNRLAGSMLKFSPDKMLKDGVTKAGKEKVSHITQLERLMDSGELEGASDEEKEAMRNEIADLRQLGSNASRTKVLRTAPTIAKWAERTHNNYAKGIGSESTRSYPPDLKSASTSLAKNMDLNLTDLSDAPRGPKQREQWRQIFNKVQQKMADAGIDMNHANNQAVLWFMEQQLFRKAGSRNRASYDYLDAAHRLVRKVQSGELPQMEEPMAAAA